MLKDLFSLEGRVALVTGGSRGIGRMIATGLLYQGAKVYITARKAAACEATAAELSQFGPCIALPIDVSSVEGARQLAAEIGRRAAESRAVLHVIAGRPPPALPCGSPSRSTS